MLKSVDLGSNDQSHTEAGLHKVEAWCSPSLLGATNSIQIVRVDHSKEKLQRPNRMAQSSPFRLPVELAETHLMLQDELMIKGLLVFLALAAPTAMQIPMPAVPPAGYVDGADVKLAYWVYGQSSKATPLFAVNGGPGLSHIYMTQNDVWLQIAKDRKVIFYDQRGTGKSLVKHPNVAMSMDAQVADLDSVRAALHLDKIDLCGDSYGGFLVTAYTVAHPEHVRRLIISDGVVGWKSMVHLFPQVFPDKLELQEMASKTSTASDEYKEQQGLRDHFDMIFYSREKLDDYMSHAKDLGYSLKTGQAVQAATEDLDLTSKLSTISASTLVITGRYDMNVAPLTAWQIYKQIPGATFQVFEESGHLPSYEEPKKYVQVVSAFLGKD
jgi:proline iminopeptidase